MIYEKLNKIIKEYPKTGSFAPGASQDEISSVEITHNVNFEPSLRQFYSNTKGGSILNYRFYMINKSNKVKMQFFPDLITPTNNNLCKGNSWAKANIFTFMGTSISEEYVVIKNTKDISDNNIIAYLSYEDRYITNTLFPLGSSFECFMGTFCQLIKESVETCDRLGGDFDGLYEIGETGVDDIDSESEDHWPYSYVDQILENDPELVQLLKNGRLKKYYQDCEEYSEMIEDSLKRIKT